MCSLVAHDKRLLAYEYDESSIVYRIIPKHITTEALATLVVTLNVIDIWPKMLKENYDARRVAYIAVMKDMFKQIPLTLIKAMTPKQKVQILMTETDGGWYIEKISKGIRLLRRSTLSRKAQEKEDEN